MNKKVYLKLLILTLLLSGSFWDNFYCGEAREVVNTIRDLETASKNKDMQKLEEILTEDFFVWYDDGRYEKTTIVHTREEYIQAVEEYPMPKRSHFASFDISFSGAKDISYVNNNFVSPPEEGWLWDEGYQGKLTLIKDGLLWRIKEWQKNEY